MNAKALRTHPKPVVIAVGVALYLLQPCRLGDLSGIGQPTESASVAPRFERLARTCASVGLVVSEVPKGVVPDA